MNILFILENYHPHIGGVEIVFRNVCEGLARKGHDVTVLTHRLPKTKKQEIIGGVRIVRVASMDSRYLFTFTSIPKAIHLAKSADLIHTTTFNAAPPAWLASRIANIPVMITVHEVWIGKWREFTDFGAVKAWVHDFLERLVFALPYDKYVCVSEATTKSLNDVLPERKKQTITIHNGFEGGPWHAKAKGVHDLRMRLDLKDKFVILGYGRPGTSKGFGYAIEAFSLIKKKIPNAELILILSKDKQYAHVVERFKEIAPRGVRILPSLPHRELPQYVQMADCVVLPSLTEGFGYVALEASHAGTPIVASNTASIPEVIGGKYVLVTPKSPTAIADGVIRVKNNDFIIKNPKPFPWKKAIANYEQAYRSMLLAIKRTNSNKARTTTKTQRASL